MLVFGMLIVTTDIETLDCLLTYLSISRYM